MSVSLSTFDHQRFVYVIVGERRYRLTPRLTWRGLRIVVTREGGP